MSSDLSPDWILQQTLEIQKKANVAWLNSKPEIDDGGLTLTVLGCGTMGTAILAGIMESLSQTDKGLLNGDSSSSSEQKSTAQSEPRRLPTQFRACVRTVEGMDRVGDALSKYKARLIIDMGRNPYGVQKGDIILLACEPHAIRDILAGDEIRQGLAGKLLISVVSGVTEIQIHEILYSEAPVELQKCTIVRAMPNIAAQIRESMTVIATPDKPLPEDTDRLVTWIFTRIGSVRRVPSCKMDVCTALCGSGPAFAALMVESMAAGAISMGLSRDDAYAMATQVVRGSTGLLLHGQHPAVLRDKISTPGGATIHGLQTLEEGGLRVTVAKAIREAAMVAGGKKSER